MKNISIVVALAILGGLGWYLVKHNSSTSTVATPAGVNVASSTVSDTLCSDSSGHTRIVCLANALTSSVSADVLAKLQLPYTLEDAQKWSNFPPMGYKNRVGPTLSEFTSEQFAIVKAIMIEASGTAENEGWDEITQILNADDFLQINGNGNRDGFTSGNYHIAFLGIPSNSGTWELQFGGYHLAFANTYKDGALVGATPSFRGIEPFETFTQNGRENVGLQQEQVTFSALLKSLSTEEQATAKLGQTFTDIIVGPQKDNTFPTTQSGLKVSGLSSEKQELLLKAIETYVGDISSEESQKLMAKYKAELNDTYVAYSGTLDLNTESDYIRIDGPSLWIEISMQGGRSWDGIHPHTVWRDKNTDYGG